MRTKITTVGALRFSETEGLKLSLLVGDKEKKTTVWLEALADAFNWPGLGKYPEKPKSPPRPSSRDPQATKKWGDAKTAAEEEWKRVRGFYEEALHADPNYRQQALEYIDLQNRGPQFLWAASGQHNTMFWVYREKVISLESTDPEIIFQKEDGGLKITDMAVLLIKHHVFKKKRLFSKV